MWHFNCGLHASTRFSGRYETLLRFTNSDDYTFNLDPVPVSAKYHGKRHFNGQKIGQPSGTRSVRGLPTVDGSWFDTVRRTCGTCLWDVPNVKASHPEKAIHPCQYPIELMERCVLAMTNEGDRVLDQFSGVAVPCWQY